MSYISCNCCSTHHRQKIIPNSIFPPLLHGGDSELAGTGSRSSTLGELTLDSCHTEVILILTATLLVDTIVILMFYMRNLKVRAVSILPTCTNLMSELASHEHRQSDSRVHTHNPHTACPLLFQVFPPNHALLQVSHVGGESRLTLNPRFWRWTTEWMVVLFPRMSRTGGSDLGKGAVKQDFWDAY